MLKFVNGGQVVMTEMDDGTIETPNQKLAEALEKQGATVNHKKDKKEDAE